MRKEKELRLRLSERGDFLSLIQDHTYFPQAPQRVIGRAEGQIEALKWVLGEEEKKE